MGELGPEKLILIMLALLLLFGARRIPEIGRSLGEGIREFKRSFGGDVDAPRERATPEWERESSPPPQRLSAAPPPASGEGVQGVDAEREGPKRLLP